MPRIPNTHHRRRQIALALQQVMATKGYDGASIHDIASAAQLTPGLVHYHFENKQAILLALLDHLVEQQNQRIEDQLDDKVGLEAVDAFIDSHLALGRSADPEALACWIALSGEALRQKEVGTAFGEALQLFQERLHQILKNGDSLGEFRCTEPLIAASAIFACIQGYFSLAATARNLIPKGSAAPAVRSMARALLANPETTGRRTE